MRLRKDLLTPTSTAPEVHTFEPEQVLLVRYALASGAACVFLAFDGHRRAISAALCPGLWTTLLDSAAELWRGPGSIVPGEISSSCKVTLDLPPHSVTVLRCSTP